MMKDTKAKKRKGGMLTFPLMLCSSLILLTNEGVNSEYTPFGFQSGKDSGTKNSSSLAGSLAYDKEQELVYVTGGIYNPKPGQTSQGEHSDCVLSVLKLNDPNASDMYSKKFLYSIELGISNVNEVCSDVEVFNPNPNTPDEDAYKTPSMFAIGHTEPDGLLTELKKPAASDALVYGFSLVIDLPNKPTGTVNQNSGEDVKLIGGAILHNDKVQYPVAMTHDLENRFVFVAMLSSTSINLNDGYKTTTEQLNENSIYPYDMTAGGGYIKPIMGKDFSFTIKKLELKTKEELDNEPISENGYKRVYDVKWTREYEPINDPQSRIADIMYVPSLFSSGFLIFAGTTYGYGNAFGAPTEPTMMGDIDGYVTKLDATTGKLPTSFNSENSKRIQSLDFSNGSSGATSSGKMDEIKGLCINEIEPTHFYVVGSTKGLLKEIPNAPLNTKDVKSPFIMKIKTQTMETVWIEQIFTTGQSDAVAYSCSVTPDNNDVHIAGTVYGGDALVRKDNSQTVSAGKADIFVASFSVSDGSQRFITQSGSKEDDWLARGKGIVCDKDGNAIILGSTRGHFHRLVSNDLTQSDFVVMSVRRTDGYVQKPVDASDHIFKITPKPPPAPTEKPESDPEPKTGGLSDAGKVGEIFMIVVLCVTFAGSCFIMAAKIYVRKDIEYDGAWDRNHDSVMQYLEDFDDNTAELHIRHSATGGIHGIYDFDHKGYEYEKNNEEVTVSLTSAADHIDTDTDAILKDALFMDDEKDSKKGTIKTPKINGINGDDFDEKSERRQSYLGLVDSYNQSWKERSPHTMSSTNETSRVGLTSPPSSAFPHLHIQEADFDGDYDSGDDQVKETWGKEIV